VAASFQGRLLIAIACSSKAQKTQASRGLEVYDERSILGKLPPSRRRPLICCHDLKMTGCATYCPVELKENLLSPNDAHLRPDSKRPSTRLLARPLKRIRRVYAVSRCASCLLAIWTTSPVHDRVGEKSGKASTNRLLDEDMDSLAGLTKRCPVTPSGRLRRGALSCGPSIFVFSRHRHTAA
jgi:hypothetical protein